MHWLQADYYHRVVVSSDMGALDDECCMLFECPALSTCVLDNVGSLEAASDIESHVHAQGPAVSCTFCFGMPRDLLSGLKGQSNHHVLYSRFLPFGQAVLSLLFIV